VDAAGVSRAYPWDPKYRVFSKAAGTLNGWFEGKLVLFDFSGHVDLKSYSPTTAASLVPLPLDGSTDYHLTPDEVRVANADGRFYSTSMKADGLVDEKMSDLRVSLSSSDLKDIAFVYPDANGTGTFDGTVT